MQFTTFMEQDEVDSPYDDAVAVIHWSATLDTRSWGIKAVDVCVDKVTLTSHSTRRETDYDQHQCEVSFSPGRIPVYPMQVTIEDGRAFVSF